LSDTTLDGHLPPGLVLSLIDELGGLSEREDRLAWVDIPS
jgi:hypothetical protein